MDILEKFNNFFDEFQRTFLWGQMVATSERSTFHREENVGVHTKLVLDWYKTNFYEKRTDHQRSLTLLAALFHDVAKPKAEIIKHSAERGEYRAYHGHELLSARMWTDYALSHRSQIEEFDFTLVDVSSVALMIEHHVPFATKDKKKRLAVKQAFLSRMGPEGHQAWTDLLLSDQNGRISDNKEQKLAEVDLWLKEWEQL